MTDSNKSRKRNTLLEFTLPSALAEATMNTIGPRKMAKLSPDARSKVVGALNVAAEEISQAIAADQPAKRRAAAKPKTDPVEATGE